MMAQRSHQRRLSHPSYSAKAVPGAKLTCIAGVDHARLPPGADIPTICAGPPLTKLRRLSARAEQSTQPFQPAGDGPANFVRRIFLDEMDSLDSHFGLRWQASGEFKNLTVREDSARLGLEEQLWHTAGLQPFCVGVHGRSYVGGVAFDRDFARERQRRPPPLAGLGERPAVLCHLFV